MTSGLEPRLAEGANATHVPLRPQHATRPAVESRKAVVRGADDLFRSLYTRSGVSSDEVLAVTSAVDGEGKTTIALGLALTIAQDFPQIQVCLVETDLARPVLAVDFGVPLAPGLLEFLAEETPLDPIVRSTFRDNLTIVPAGAGTTNASRLLRSQRMATALELLKRTHGVVVLDLPSVLSNSDTLLLADHADGLLLVVRAGQTPAGVLAEAAELLDAERLRGIVMNAAESRIPRWLRSLAGI